MNRPLPPLPPRIAPALLAAAAAFLLDAFITAPAPAAQDEKPARPNILFLAVDDLNHWVAHLKRNPQTITPQLDKLASRGVSFSHAYCAAPACNPSRAALMSGLRPSTSGVYDNGQDWRPQIAPELTLPSTFRAAGYYVCGAGKIYHGGFDRREEWDDYLKQEGREPLTLSPRAKDGGVGGIRFAPLDCKDEDLPDYAIASYGITELQKKHDRPFFLAVGLHKPHMAWNVPEKYYDMHPLQDIILPPHTENDLSDVPPPGVKMAGPQGDHAAMLASGRWKEAVQGYLAAISFCDAMIGRVLDALDKSEYRDNTVIVLWGDHGWHLGEKEHWRKFALWEEATRAPLIWVAPGVSKANAISSRTVDFMSIYPTLCDLAGIPIPAHVEGPSLRPLLADPAAGWDRPALTTYRFQNHALRNENLRYIRYADGTEELYDEVADPYEWTNIAASAAHEKDKKALAASLPTVNKDPVRSTPEKGKGKAARVKAKAKAKTNR